MLNGFSYRFDLIKNENNCANFGKNYLRGKMQELLLKTFKAVSDSQRLLILGILKQRDMYVCQLAKAINLAYSTTSQHLHILAEAGLICDRKNGKWVKYCLAPKSINPYRETVFKMIDECLKSDSKFKKKIEHILQQQIEKTC